MGAVEDLRYVGERLAAHARATIDDGGQSDIARAASAGQRVTAAHAAFEAARLAVREVDRDELTQTFDGISEELHAAGLLTQSVSLSLEDFMRLVLARLERRREQDQAADRLAGVAEVAIDALSGLERDFRAQAGRSESARRTADRCLAALAEIRGRLTPAPQAEEEAGHAAA